MNNIVDQINKNNLCSGCGLCASVSNKKITMVLNKEGYLRPKVLKPLTSEDNNLIKDICPGLVVGHEDKTSNYHNLWGPIEKVMIGYATDSKVRFIASSGGAISALLVYLLEAKEVNYVLHIGVSEENPLLNKVKISTTKDEIIQNSGSRYSPSSPLETVSHLLEKEGQFALVGKPCDISAIKRYAKYDKRVNDKIKYFISFFCAGIPSMIGTEKILNHFKVSRSEIKNFRYRGFGWPGNTRVETKKGKVYEMTYEKSWGTILNKYLQLRCKICADGTGEFADVSCADAWVGDSKGYPDFSEKDGRSLIIVRTKTGGKLVENCIKNGYIANEKLDISQIERIQPYQTNRKKTLLSRLLTLNIFMKKTPRYYNLRLFQNMISAGIVKNLTAFYGTFKRIIKGRI